jgi:hypothetical protein
MLELAQSIQADFPRTTVVLWTGHEIPEELLEEGATHKILEPLLVENEERAYRMRQAQISSFV